MAERGETPAERIVPADFVDRYPEADSIAEALAIAEQEPTSTPEDEQDRCPNCDSRRLSFKPHDGEHKQKVDTQYVCAACGEHFDNPADPHPDWSSMAFEWVSDPVDPDERGEMVLFSPLDRSERVELAIRLYKPWSDAGPSYRDLEPLFPHGHWWIGKRVRAWKDGEHRDLVPEPAPSVDASADRGGVATDGGRRRRWDAYGSSATE